MSDVLQIGRVAAVWCATVAAVVLCAAPEAAQQSQTAGGPPGGGLAHVAVSNTNPSTIYVSAGAGGVFRSVDAGASWYEVDRGLPSDAFCELVVDPRVAGVVYATCGSSVFKTADGGGLWTPLTIQASPGIDWAELVIAPSDSNVLYLRCHNCRQLFVSRTAGRVWRAVKGQRPLRDSWDALAVDPADPAILYATSGHRLFKSVDTGASWTTLNRNLPANEGIGTVRVDVRRPGTVFVGAGHRLFRSTSAGDSWTAIGDFHETIDEVLTASSASPGAIVVRANTALFRSDNDGRSWRSIGDGLDEPLIQNVALDPASDATVYLATFSGFFVTTDSGVHWRQGASLGLLRSAVGTITVDRADPATVRVSTRTGTFASTDSGKTWRPTPGLAPSTVDVDHRWQDSRPDGQVPQRLTIVPGDPLRAFASIGAVLKPKSLWRTVDGGATWQHADDCSPLITTLACQAIVDPNDSRVIYEITVAESPEAGWETVRRSIDGGGSWQRMKTPSVVWLFSVLPTRPLTTIFADLPIASRGGNHTLMMSVDNGDRWIRCDRGLPPLARVTALAMDPSQPLRLFAGTDGRGVFVSTDGGRHWRPSGAALAR